MENFSTNWWDWTEKTMWDLTVQKYLRGLSLKLIGDGLKTSEGLSLV